MNVKIPLKQKKFESFEFVILKYKKIASEHFFIQKSNFITN